MNRFFVEPYQVGGENIDITDKDDIKHITKVLRLKVGDKIEVSDSSEFEYLVEIVSMPKAGNSADSVNTADRVVGGGSKILGKILDKQAFRGEATTKVTLFQCVPKQGKMETIIQKSVELGVRKIVPVFCSRTVVKDKAGSGKAANDKAGNDKADGRGKLDKASNDKADGRGKKDKAGSGKVERWNKISAEAVKQCKRGLIPRVENPVNLSEMTKTLDSFDLVLFPYENENGVTMKTVLHNRWKTEGGAGSEIRNSESTNSESTNSESTNIALIIGPEGGFSDEEASLIKEAGGKALSLGKTILRTETAGPAALAMIMYELEL